MRWLKNIFYFFPLRLFLAHCRSHILLLLSWVLILLGAYGQVAHSYGTYYLFLSPEYLGTTNYFSFLLLGLCFGIFFITWNMVSYLLISNHYPFIASVKWPVAMFSFNNAIVPLLFFVFYIYRMVEFQLNEMYASYQEIIWQIVGFCLGFTFILLLSAIYFILSNKDVFGYIDKKDKVQFDGLRKEKKWQNKDRVDYFLSRSFRIRATRDVSHYDESLLKKVFKQNHFNAFLLILFNVALLIGLGFLIDKSIFEIPAGGAVFLFFSVLVSIVGLIYYWTGTWGNLAFMLFIVILNNASGLDVFRYDNQAYGLQYQNTTNAIYHLDTLEQIASIENREIDKQNTIKILEKWKKKVTKGKSRYYKPKMFVVLASGGGLRASVFSMNIVQQLDSLSKGELMNHTVLMSGASGGMLGLGYYRELYLRQQLGLCANPYSEQYQDNIAKDLLNKIWTSIVTNDLYYPFQTRKIDGISYRLDRGMMMEMAFNQHTEHVLDKPLSAYSSFEQNATIPLNILAAVNVLDSRKMLISSQPISYMMKSFSKKNNRINYEIDAIDFGRFFKDNQGYNLRYTTALRMNASYPLILPAVSLPSTPKIDVADAGFVDNFGIDLTVRFLSVFKDWVNDNTSGVVIVQIRDSPKEDEIYNFEYRKVFQKLFASFGSLSENLTIKQDYQHDYMLENLNEVLKNKLQVIRFEYEPLKTQKKASLSFHLAKRELDNIKQSANNANNQKSLNQAISILK